MNNRNRSTLTPGRVYIVPEGGGSPYYAAVTRADNPTDVGTAFDKTYMDEVLAAKGTTAGTSPNYTLTQTNFPGYQDGQVVRICLHAAIAGPMKLNIANCGVKSCVTAKGTPVSGYGIGVWLTFVYSSTNGNFVLQGDGGSSCIYGKKIRQISSFQFDTEEGFR